MTESESLELEGTNGWSAVGRHWGCGNQGVGEMAENVRKCPIFKSGKRRAEGWLVRLYRSRWLPWLRS
jgi:hypothetical protein